MWSPNRSSRGGHPVKLVVIHGDAGKSDEGTLSHIANPASQVSYHYLIGRKANHHLVPDDEKAWHAGRSAWPGCTVGNSVNPTSIGIGIANDGTERFLPDQIKRAAEVCAKVCAAHNVPIHMIRGHFEVSPGRKTDPWAHFNWDEFWTELGRASR